MLTQINHTPTQADWLALKDAGMAVFIFGMLTISLGIAFLEWWEFKPKVKGFIKFIKPKKSESK